ncbi:M23 family metallopeptidase [Brevibacillus sp. HB1.2]|uniref:M23 family metallopeptidase n=1 Tax=Brevibacillus TaxID=55080 RepID=UPI00035E0EE9|nr:MULTISPECIES: M23 family metallopeptidase [unclassified Brevibacillus]ATF11153.1 M23 family peptidase [Brevibacillus brevis X23]NRS17013.1 M23 family metallopeptidase [Brevibacillus sp. HB1.4B]NTU21319.1 M23 family metallopeptidase [Brevibacillus sp. HB1.2]
MQTMSNELRRILSERLKLGELSKPACRVEIDRLIFVPGRTEELDFIMSDRREEKTLTRTIIQDGSGDGGTALSKIPFVFPVEGKSIRDITAYMGDNRKHQGIDIACPVGTPIKAAWAGQVKKVTVSEKYTSFGFRVEIQHADGMWTRYAHMSEIHVKTGDYVTQGTIIGKSGNTGDVRSAGVTNMGTYDDPNSPRSKGRGAHLHFEVWNGQAVIDPFPYMNGSKHLFAASSNNGAGVTTDATYVGTPGATLFDERFTNNTWHTKSVYKVDELTKKLSMIERSSTEHSNLTFTFDPKGYKTVFPSPTVTTGMNLKLTSVHPGIFSMGFSTNFGEGAGELRVFFNGKMQVKVIKFSGTENVEIRDIPFPNGEMEIRIELFWNGKQVNRFSLQYIQIKELQGRPDLYGNKDKVDPTVQQEFFEEREITSTFMPGQPRKVSLQVGKFVYMDTLTLDNINHIEMDDQYEMESCEARITISNPGGYYSPDYNPFYFPETYKETPWSYFVNGFHVGVLSENTPVRIYMGYGLNLMRVFTGLIDKLDLNGEESTMTIYCRDMYKKILNKVITEDKQYPSDVGHSAAHDTNVFSSMARRDKIISIAKKQAKQQGPELDYKFLLAIAEHETKMGTLGKGLPPGDFILGYGCYTGEKCDPQYQGLERQLYRGAVRYREAMASKGWRFQSVDDVKYFWQGGDKGAYQWASDTNWYNSVWQIYQKFRSSTEFDAIPEWESTAPVPTEPTAKAAYLKSAIVQDLIAYAGMYGWRSNPQDIFYPYAIVQETSYTHVTQATGKVFKAVPDKEGEFVEVDPESTLTPKGWKNPFVEPPGRKFESYQYKVGEAIAEIMKETPFRSYCDRYGTYRLEEIDMNRPIVATFTEHDNLITIHKTIDFSRGKSHLVILDEENKVGHFVDTEILMELKGEVRTGVRSVPFAKTDELKRLAAQRTFFDLKRLCRTLQISIPGNPALDVLDRIYIIDSNTTTREAYTIKGIRTMFDAQNGYMQILDLFWSNNEGAIV